MPKASNRNAIQWFVYNFKCRVVGEDGQVSLVPMFIKTRDLVVCQTQEQADEALLRPILL